MPINTSETRHNDPVIGRALAPEFFSARERARAKYGHVKLETGPVQGRAGVGLPFGLP
jgi:hypothetical protein